MTFSGRVKEELCRRQPAKKCCGLAECYGILLFCSSWSRREVRIVTECDPFCRRLPLLFRKALRLEFDKRPQPGETGKRVFAITSPDKLDALDRAFGYDGQTVARSLNFPIIEEDCCKLAFCRGAFLAGGAVTDPEKDYHMEWATNHIGVGRAFPVVLRELGFEARQATRKGNYLTYIKQSETITDLLTALGARVLAMDVINAKEEKRIRNRVNRRVNCDAANLDKAVEAAQDQLEVIKKLEEAGILSTLPDKLQETARLRQELPECTLSELAAQCVPPVSKSCLNHRLRKLSALAASLD